MRDEIIKRVRLRGKISSLSDNLFWAQDKPDETGEMDILLELIKQKRKQYYYTFQPLGETQGSIYNTHRIYFELKIGPGEVYPESTPNFPMETADDFLKYVILSLNKVSTLSKTGNPLRDALRENPTVIVGKDKFGFGVTSKTGFLGYWIKLQEEELRKSTGDNTLVISPDYDTKFFEVVQDPYNENVIPRITPGYYDVWNNWISIVKKEKEDYQKENPPKPDPVIVRESVTEQQIIDPGKITQLLTFNVETKDTFIIQNPTDLLKEKINGNLTIITNPAEWSFRSEEIPGEELDPEYTETEIQIEEYDDPDIVSTINIDAALYSMEQKEIENRRKAESSETPMSGGGSMTGKIDLKYDTGKSVWGWGVLKKGMSDKDILKVMVNYVEGGYGHPVHVFDFKKQSDKELYGNSGETLWGIDRFAGQTEKDPNSPKEGKAFWEAIDKVSGYGNYADFSRKTPSKNWDISKYPKKSSAWVYGFMPNPQNTTGYDVMYNAFVTFAMSHLEKYSERYFKLSGGEMHPFRKIIYDDSRVKFMWTRSTWNGVGWFSWYANGRKSIKGIKWAYDNVTKDVDELIIWDLNNRLKMARSMNSTLIEHDVKRMAQLMGISSSGSFA